MNRSKVDFWAFRCRDDLQAIQKALVGGWMQAQASAEVQAGAGAVAPESRPKAAGARGRGTRPGVTQA